MKERLKPDFVSFLATSLATSSVYFLLESYVAVRMALCISPSFLLVKHRLGAIKDPRVMQALSLMLLELLTVVPHAMDIGITGEFVPFSIGALGVMSQLPAHSRM